MEKTETLSTIFFYLFLPIVIALSIIIGRLYNSRKESQIKEYNLTQGLILGNILIGILGIIFSLFLYAYTINPNPSNMLNWEFLAHAIISILALIAGIGIGAHLAGVSLERILRDKLSKPQFAHTSKAIHHFHAGLGHKLPFTSLLLITYTLTLLDLFKGTITKMGNIQTLFALSTAIILGTFLSFIFIITYTSNLMLKISILILISVLLASASESRNLHEHPVSFIFTVFYITIIIWTESKKYLPKKILQKFIKITQSWLKWDGIILHPDHQVFRKIKEKYYKDKRSFNS